MANPEHLIILKQGVDVWNKWRKDNPYVEPDLIDIELKVLSKRHRKLITSNLSGINFSNTNLSDSKLINVNLANANFTEAWLLRTDLGASDIKHGEFEGANLAAANFGNSIIEYVNFSWTNMLFTRFQFTKMKGVNFYKARFGGTVLTNCNFQESLNIETIEHQGGSELSFSTFLKSGDSLPQSFLRGCGVPEGFITYAKSLTTNPIDFYSCFISFTEKDDAFSQRLYNDMQMAGIRCWRWKEDAKWGRTLRKEIDEAVRYYDKLVVICSKDSLNAPAVLEEIERALDKEDAQKRAGDEGEVLFPIRIDDFIFDGWESELKVRLTKKNIGDFRDWNGDPNKYRKSVERLVKYLNRRSAAR